tara:strand:- start:5952 stop:6440 length:489 start_codon:yes stop_codon:yes gene_type:complete
MDGYSTNILCTYLNLDVEPELQEDVYRGQMLQIFNLSRWDDDIINSLTEKLYLKLTSIFKYNTKSKYLQACNLNNILTKLRNTKSLDFIILMCGTDDLTIFKLLFKYEYYQYAHSYFCYILNNYKVDNIDLSSCLNIFETSEDDINNELLEKSYKRLYNNIK